MDSSTSTTSPASPAVSPTASHVSPAASLQPASKWLSTSQTTDQLDVLTTQREAVLEALQQVPAEARVPGYQLQIKLDRMVEPDLLKELSEAGYSYRVEHKYHHISGQKPVQSSRLTIIPGGHEASSEFPVVALTSFRKLFEELGDWPRLMRF